MPLGFWGVRYYRKKWVMSTFLNEGDALCFAVADPGSDHYWIGPSASSVWNGAISSSLPSSSSSKVSGLAMFGFGVDIEILWISATESVNIDKAAQLRENIMNERMKRIAPLKKFDWGRPGDSVSDQAQLLLGNDRF